MPAPPEKPVVPRPRPEPFVVTAIPRPFFSIPLLVNLITRPFTHPDEHFGGILTLSAATLLFGLEIFRSAKCGHFDGGISSYTTAGVALVAAVLVWFNVFWMKDLASLGTWEALWICFFCGSFHRCLSRVPGLPPYASDVRMTAIGLYAALLGTITAQRVDSEPHSAPFVLLWLTTGLLWSVPLMVGLLWRPFIQIWTIIPIAREDTVRAPIDLQRTDDEQFEWDLITWKTDVFSRGLALFRGVFGHSDQDVSDLRDDFLMDLAVIIYRRWQRKAFSKYEAPEVAHERRVARVRAEMARRRRAQEPSTAAARRMARNNRRESLQQMRQVDGRNHAYRGRHLILPALQKIPLVVGMAVQQLPGIRQRPIPRLPDQPSVVLPPSDEPVVDVSLEDILRAAQDRAAAAAAAAERRRLKNRLRRALKKVARELDPRVRA